MLKIIALIVIVLIVAILAIAATKPGTIDVQRSASISAPPDKIFPLINDFHKWGTWSPWEKKDPDMKRTFSGTPAGKGSVYEWDGNSQVGKGRMEITDTQPPSKVTIQLDFLKPFEGHNVAEFTVSPQGGSNSNVIWTMRGPANFLTKVMSVFVSMDSMIGPDFEAGLANLKAAAEK